MTKNSYARLKKVCADKSVMFPPEKTFICETHREAGKAIGQRNNLAVLKIQGAAVFRPGLRGHYT